MTEVAKKPFFRPKSQWQKDDCIKSGCLNKSTLEAIWKNAIIRCCENEECKEEASSLAQSLTL